MNERLKYRPPRLARRILSHFCSDHWIDELLGDLEEQYADHLEHRSKRTARMLYYWEVLHLLRPHIIKKPQKPHTLMIRLNHIKISYRSLLKNKVYALINVLGLSVGIASVMLITTYVTYETSYDKFFRDSDRIYRIALHRVYPTYTKDFGTSSIMLAPTLEENYPQVEEVTRLHRLFFNNEIAVRVEENSETFNETKFLFADSAFFKVFSHEFLVGNPSTALDGIDAVVVTESTAIRYFGTSDVLGNTITANNGPLTVTGVIRDIPANSHIHFDLIGSIYGLNFLTNAMTQDNWISPWVYTYVKLREGTDPGAFEAQFPNLVDTYGGANIAQNNGSDYKEKGHAFEYFLQPLQAIHLRSKLDVEVEPNSDMAYVYILSAIALVILAISGINFINLSIARSTERAKEVGIRKVMGSSRSGLIGQFLTESVLVCFLAALIALGLIFLVIPRFNELLGTALDFSVIFQPLVILSLLAFIVSVGIVSGFYPALVISALQPSHVLKGSFKHSKKGVGLRNTLISFQFIISIMMISGSIIVGQQMRYLRDKDLGFNKEHVLVVKQSARLGTSYNAFRNALLQMSEVSSVGGAIYMPGEFHGSNIFAFNDPAVSDLRANTVTIDDDYMPTLELDIVEGRSFSSSFSDSLNVIINQSAVRALNLTNPIGMKLRSTANPGTPVAELTIVGVVKDYNYYSLHSEISPLVIFNGTSQFIPNVTAVRVRAGDYDRTLRTIQAQWEELSEQTFSYSFLDEDLNRQYKADQDSAFVFDVFTIIAIVMSCTGLFGLATYIVNHRSKEMSIRKVLGASLPHIIAVFSREFLLLIGIAFALAVPLAWLALEEWLTNFAYHVDVGALAFLLTGGVTLLLVLITVSYQAIRIARVNPVKLLRSE